LISFLRHRHISEYEERRQRLPNAWLRADEITILNVLEVVRKEIEAATKLQPSEEEGKKGGTPDNARR
jgi:hypothetical protein